MSGSKLLPEVLLRKIARVEKAGFSSMCADYCRLFGPTGGKKPHAMSAN